MEILVLPFRLLHAKKNMRLFIIGCFYGSKVTGRGPPPSSGIIRIVFLIHREM